jgi:hypothetical protein
MTANLSAGKTKILQALKNHFLGFARSKCSTNATNKIEKQLADCGWQANK